jgi:hypothetical protein
MLKEPAIKQANYKKERLTLCIGGMIKIILKWELYLKGIIMRILFYRKEVIMRGFVNVKEPPYSAAFSGGLNAQPAIQRALDDVKAVGGGTVFLPTGTYYFF